jgi:iron uptake system component EfeO
MIVRVLALLAVSSIAFLVAACGGAASSAPSASAAASGPPDGVVTVQTAEYKFDPSTITVAAGATTFRVTNVGNEEHEFEVFKGADVVDEIEGLVPGLTRDLTLELTAGEYTYACKLPGHEEAGMTGTLTVTAS